MIQLTRAEEEVMQVLWKLENAFVKEILEQFPEPKPAYNTLSTIVRILEQKGVVSHEAIGRSHRYFPVLSKTQYRSASLERLSSDYFGGSFKELASCWLQDNQINIDDLEEIKALIGKRKN
ncbi:MAG: BlaI/MecI/CopY family transcriptional regulator [Flavobacteriales bacterium]|nr:BlaI/MecI/CopY family transcriptional regulator [Flavobacteriales bacterium]